MHPDTLEFLDVLFGRCESLRSSARLTFTVIHPTSQRPTPSRHITLDNHAALFDTLQRLSDTNQMGWGAYCAVGLRKPGLSRWKRGGTADVVALPAFYTDIDDPTDTTLMKLRGARLPPSMIVHSGGGYHAYWMLDEPTTDLDRARQVLQGLTSVFGGDPLSVAQSLRLPGTRNTKTSRGGAMCHVIETSDRHYSLADFQLFLPSPCSVVSNRLTSWQRTDNKTLNPVLIETVIGLLQRDYGAQVSHRGDWMAALCPYGHARDRPGAHFFFNSTIGCGCCHGRHGTRRLTELCSTLGIDVALCGGVYRS